MQVELVTYFYFPQQRNTFTREKQNKKDKGLIKEQKKVNFCSIIKRKLYSLYFDTGLLHKWQKNKLLKEQQRL
jgi:hypothetical protein